MKKFTFTLLSVLLLTGYLFPQTQLSFRFSNPHVIFGTPDMFQFDVDVKADGPGTFHRDLQVYFDYNTVAFGPGVVENGKLIVSTLSLMSDHYQIVNITDNTTSKIAIITEAIEEMSQSGSSDYFNEIGTSWTGLLRFQIEIAGADEFTGISFDEALMNGGQYMQSLTSFDPIVYLNPNIYENTIANLSLVGQDLQLTAGWAGISSYTLPFDPAVEYIFDPIVNELMILQNFDGAYLPSSGYNTLGGWDNTSGYVIKVNDNCQLKIMGSNYEGNTLTLATGWNLIPILSECDINTQDFFGSIISSVAIVQEVAGTGLYWPSHGINTLTELNPGKAYYIKMSVSETISFPLCD
jgi:hypothetical protein